MRHGADGVFVTRRRIMCHGGAFALRRCLMRYGDE
jgi:hypothetical protein